MKPGLINKNMKEANKKMGVASENLGRIVGNMSGIAKVEQVFVTDIGGKSVDWDMTFQFDLDNEDPFYVEIKGRKVKLFPGTASDAEIVIIGDNNAIVKICNGKGDIFMQLA